MMKSINRKIEWTFSSEFASKEIDVLPAGYIDKTICGCGMTALALENTIPTIVAVPSVELIKNKCMQYPNDRTRNTVLGVWGDISLQDIEAFQFNENIIKIVVTYDSINKVAHLLPSCHLVVDESNLLIPYTKLKPDVIDNLFKIAKKYKDTVSFISATPTPLCYMPSWISDITQVKINWSASVKSYPILCERTFPYKSLRSEFIEPLNKNKVLTVAGRTFSKVIVFVNSVQQIVDVIKESGISKLECGIICGDNLKNDLKIIGINRYRTGVMPRFTFVTSAGFQGIDLSDESAMTIVVSNTSKNWQMVDMLTDLKQAVSRQRNKNNPNYGSYIYIYNQSIFKKSEDELLSIVSGVRRKIDLNIPHYNYLKSIDEGECFISDADIKSYTIFKDGVYTINENAFNADKYFIQEVRNQYVKGFEIVGLMENASVLEPIELPKNVTYRTLVDYFRNSTGTVDWGVYSTAKSEWKEVIEASYKFYKRVWENYTTAKLMVENHGDVYEQVRIEVQSIFKLGCRYSRYYIKEELQKIYDKYEVKRKALHGDLQEYYTIRNVKMNGERFVEINKK